MESTAATHTVERLVGKLALLREQIPGMTDETATGYPVPLLADRELALAFPLFNMRGRPPAPPQVYEPRWIAYIDVRTGEKFAWKALGGDPAHSLGTHLIDPPLDMAGFRTAVARLYHAMDLLLPYSISRESPIPAQLQHDAAEFSRLWRQLAHKPLQSVYRQINPGWFARFGL